MKYFFKIYLVLGLFCFTSLTYVNAQDRQYVVVLDAGHGGKDPGNLGNGYKEKNVALKVTLQIGKALAKYKYIKVVYTRKKDVFVELHDRAKIANKQGADLFISVHCDSHSSNAYGAGTFVLGLSGNRQNLEIAKRENSVILLEEDYQKNYDYDPDSPESMIGLSLLQEENLDKSLSVASFIQSDVVKNLHRKDRRVRQANFLVLRQTVMPSVLVELGFLTNKKEGRYLNSKKGQNALANTIAKAIRKYIDRLRLNTIENTEDVVIPNVVKTDKIEFKTQIASSRRKISTKSYNFKGLKNVQRVRVGKYYKYYYGISRSYKEALKSQKLAKKKGYTTAFIAAFKNGEKISVKEALKLL
ncbi:N-acetylmuramoyl-L-alanine amidase [Flavobacteriaceae bacterium S356]|uniref:N-acetylmuramoyl-L-alanine amidase n=1 Tax=Asprobacillus argus TaxID=3076534 RepID=A0ABU3LHN1_9FLAO|nr:N-acetylmuramoyl-L-alanine amidase [Flavobacteriaceae bacterium S356]